MANAKIISFVDAAIKRAEDQQRAERDDDVKAIIEFMENELDGIVSEIEAMQQRLRKLEGQ